MSRPALDTTQVATDVDPVVAARVARLHGVDLTQVLSGAVVPDPPANVAPDGVRIDDLVVPVEDRQVDVRRYRPAAGRWEERTLVWCHGGAWIGGDLDMPEAHSVAIRAVQRLGVTVLSVGYTLAPAAQHPIPVHDVAGVVRALQDGEVDGMRPSLVALGGASAGGHLASLAAHALTAEGRHLAALWLTYPATDPVAGPWPDERPDTCPALLRFDTTLAGLAFAGYLAADPATAPDDAVPARLDPTGLPPTLVTTAAVDALAPQARAHVAHLRAHGVEVTHHQVDGALHGYLNEVAAVPLAYDALTTHLAWLGRTLDRTRTALSRSPFSATSAAAAAAAATSTTHPTSPIDPAEPTP